MNFNLTDEQKNIISEITKFKHSVQTLGGYAGTGKSTVVTHIHQAFPDFAVCAYTGKAANVLRKKGIVDASTIHSLIYKPLLDWEGKIILDDNGNPIFTLAQDMPYNGIIIDEASMVSEEIYKDLCYFKVPLLFVGDHGQLEPVSDKFNLMNNPDYKLETIHRNAGEIAHFADHLRKGFRANAFRNKDKVKFVSYYKSDEHLVTMDQIICAFNKTRVSINQKVRNTLGLKGQWPTVGDKIMCLRNDRTMGLFNGMQGYVKRTHEKPKNKMTFFSDGTYYNDLLFNPKQFDKVKYDFAHGRDEPHPFDFAYCITCHKAQGDEWDKVMVIEQRCDLWDHRRWTYTAASRAKEMILWVN